ncbi:MAG: OmpA family protein [Deltaproteobacteria bacterium]|nr:OmpA family protein [Deltaproteobacteria bacterium]MBI3388638.1 OmpA family protein [Deltaproteobacteria bacterium]
MKGVARTVILAGLGVLGWSIAARASDASAVQVTDEDRTSRNFTRDSATVGDGKIRLEVRAMALNDEGDTRLNLLGFPAREEVSRENGGIFDVIGSYGLGKSTELGFSVPTFIEKQRVGDSTTQNKDVGDVLLYGKFKHDVATHCSIAGGVELTIPTGIERKSFGTGNYATNPFVSTRYANGRFSIGAHAGYQIYAGDTPDVYNYSADIILRASHEYALRVEMSGRMFQQSGLKYNDLVVMPGIDYFLTPDFVIRPTGLAGITTEALDWGIGLGLVYTFQAPSFSLPQAPPPAVAQAAEPPPAPAPVMKKKIVLRGVNFDFSKSNIRPDAVPILDQAISTLKESSGITISVEGHTDDIGSDEYNQALSLRRAEAVRDYLASHGIAASRMTVQGFGESSPVATNDTDEGRAQNRRVELRVTQE